MEHRLGIRHAVDARVVLHVPGSNPMHGRVREASISGMFVETRDRFPGLNSVVELEMTLPPEDAGSTFRWQAMVVRRTSTGVGLMFDRLRPIAITRLLASRQAVDVASRIAAPRSGGVRHAADGQPAALR
jgi:hypothetical protein